MSPHAEILVVDDLDHHRSYVCDLLERHGHTVRSAANGRIGLETAHADEFDLIVTDVFMPEMDGIEFMRGLRAGGNTAPVIAMTAGHGGQPRPYADIMRALGARHVFNKPLDARAFVDAVEQLLIGPAEALPAT
jgi:CheY-like chemotaxis protein